MMPNPMIAAAAQLGPSSESKAETVERMVIMVEEAARMGVEFLSFPELALTPYFCTYVREEFDHYFDTTMPSPESEPLFHAAKERGISFVLPYAEKEGDIYYNSALVTNSDGRIVGKFRKIHIPGTVDPTGSGSPEILEKRYFTPGDLGFPVFETVKAKTGVLICYDRRFPESFRCLGVGGAEVICSPYNTPVMGGRSKDEGQQASELVICAGANSNACYAIAPGKAGIENGEEFIGGSFIADPSGQIIAKAQTNGDELVVGELDLERPEQARKRSNFIINRRPEMYGALVKS